MPPNKNLPNRRSIRYRGYDYRLPGAYFVTLCVHQRRCLLGSMIQDKVALTPAGQMVFEWTHALPTRFSNLILDAYIVMPNHVHWIVQKTARFGEPVEETSTLPAVVQWWKTMTTNAYFRGVKDEGWPRVEGRLWQRNYWERIIRDDAEWAQIREYTRTNPARWREDRLHPDVESP